MLKFASIPIIPQLLANLTDAGYLQPTPIQAAAIPLLIEGNDLLGIAQTGTGKTAAFSLPMLQHLVNTPFERQTGSPRALILVPTRELCTQISESLKSYSRGLNLAVTAIYGGVDQAEQVTALRAGIDVVVATPGRLQDLMKQRLLRLSKVEILVLDEADRMLDMGFLDDIQEIIRSIPAKKQTMMFSATMPESIAELARSILKNPKRVQVTPVSSTVEKIRQRVIFCKQPDKFQLLKKLLKEDKGMVLVFTKTKTTADNVQEYLAQNRMASRALHGDKSQIEREKALDHFKTGAIKVLIATDIVARGIDIQGVTHVINFDLPLEAENYVHRVGRTARAGKEGTAISFCSSSEREILENIQNLIGLTLPSEKFEGQFEVIKLKGRTVKAPTPGKSQEKTAYLDHSKRQRPVGEGEKPRPHPGFRNAKKKRK
jgi:ATP-dependent RNA helicase RhlE